MVEHGRVSVLTQPEDMDVYRPISDYAVIGDCRTAALVSPDGSIDWCCLPHFDSPAVFCRLLDIRKGGFFRLGPTDQARSSMIYLTGTNILETTFQTASGRLRLLDYMPVRKRQDNGSAGILLDNLLPFHNSGLEALKRETRNDVAAAHRINRMLTCLEGSASVDFVLKPTFDYARQAADIRIQDVGDDTAAAFFSAGGRFLVLVVHRLNALSDQAALEPLVFSGEEGTLRLRLTLRAGQGLVAMLNYARDENEARELLQQLLTHPFSRDLDETHQYWREWSASSRYTGTYQDAVARSALALKLCVFEPTGAIVAAPTTSLPESVGGVRNWDYRYTWLRDSAFTLQALARLGYYDEARDYFHFLHDLGIRNADDMRIMYSIRGESDGALEEIDLTHLSGYRDSRPVRIGNGAANQRQMDVYGEVLDAAYTYLQHEGFSGELGIRRPQRDVRRFVTMVADYVSEHWRDEDRGIWEVRGPRRPFVYSRAMCWAALDRATRMAQGFNHRSQASRWSHERDAIHENVLAHGYNPHLNAFTQYYGDHVLDAANLRLPLAGFLPWSDSRIRGTIAATQKYLTREDALIYRYRPISDGVSDELGEIDGLPGKEGTFLACAFWLIDNLCYMGQVEEARKHFERLLSYAGPLGLFAEEVDPDTGAQIGNYPQAFTHIGLINSAINIQQAQEGTLAPRV